MTSVRELELPYLHTEGMDRLQSLDAADEIAKDHWLARTDMGYAVLHYSDAVSILRDRRFHSALSQIRRMGGLEGDYFGQRRQSILSTEGEAHTRLRRLVSPAFTPAAADRHRGAMRDVFRALLDPVLLRSARRRADRPAAAARRGAVRAVPVRRPPVGDHHQVSGAAWHRAPARTAWQTAAGLIRNDPMAFAGQDTCMPCLSLPLGPSAP